MDWAFVFGNVDRKYRSIGDEDAFAEVERLLTWEMRRMVCAVQASFTMETDPAKVDVFIGAAR